MSISLNANFELLSAGLYLDARQQFNTIIEMKDFAETSIPDGFITYNKETQKHYVFNSSNTVDVTLGKWREYNSGNSSSITYPTWNSNVDYKVGNVVLKDEVRYSCIADHTSTDFETDSINWVAVLEQYYHVTQEQYNKMVSDGLITDGTKDLYIIDGNNEGGNSSSANYTSLSELGLTADATIDDVIDALKDGETALISTNEFTNYKDGMFPNQCTNDQYAVIKVEREGGSKVFLEWRQKEGNAYAIGGLNSSNKFTNWNNLVRFKKDGFADDSIVCIGDTVSADGVIQTLENLGFSNDVLTWDTGVYRVSHVSGLINLPSEITSTSPSFRLEHHDCKKWGANHNPNTKTWGVRHSVLYSEGGKVYHRYYESGDTAGVYTKDTGWRVIAGAKHHRIITQATGGYFKFKICTDPFSQPMRIIATDNYGGRIEITGANSGSYKPFKCVRTSHGTYSSYDSSNPTNNKMQKLYLYDGYFYLEVLSYTTVTFENLLEAPTFVETLENKDTEIPIVYLGSKPYYGISQLNSSKGTSIELVENTDNTLKIVEALGEGEEFVEWFGNSNDRFGLGTNAGGRINYLRIQKTSATNGIILAVTNYGKTFSRVYNGGKLENWCWDKSKATAFFNSKTFKIDITKGNENWNGNMKFGYCVDKSYGEIIISSLGKTEVMWDCSTGVRYVKSVTYTIDPNNNAHVTIGVELYDTVYGIHQLETCGDFATINSFTGDAFTGTSVAKRGATRGRNNGVGILCDVADLELTTPCTTVQIAQKMRDLANGGGRMPLSAMIGIFNNGDKTITDVPTSYGLLEIKAYGYDRLMIRYDGVTGNNYNGSWIGKIKGSNGTFSSIEWERIDGVVSTGGEPAVYSTSEQAIGTWVDGKTIYRKTIVKDSHGANAQLISGVDTFIRGYGTCERAGYVYNVPHCGLLAGHLQDEDVPYLNFKLDTSGALSTIGSGTYTISKLKVTLEYTKK